MESRHYEFSNAWPVEHVHQTTGFLEFPVSAYEIEKYNWLPGTFQECECGATRYKRESETTVMEANREHGYYSMGKYDSARDDLLHWLCNMDWANESFGSTESPSGFVWKISNSVEDVQESNTEFTSVIAEWLEDTNVTDSPAFRAELVGDFLVQTDSQGFVYVAAFDTQLERDTKFTELETLWVEWLGDEDED